MLNNHRYEAGKDLYSQSCVYGLLSRLKPKQERVTVWKQESANPSDHWCQARYLWSTQLMVHFGLLDVNDDLIGPVEKRFDRESYGPLSLDQVVW